MAPLKPSIAMNPQSPHTFTEALRLLDAYYRILVTKIAEEIVEDQDAFESSYTGRAEELIDRYGIHLQNLSRVYGDLTAVRDTLQQLRDHAGPPGVPVKPTGQRVTADTSLTTGMTVLAEWGGSWWRAEIVSVEEDGQVRVRYCGWADRWDETVPRTRLQLNIQREDQGL